MILTKDGWRELVVVNLCFLVIFILSLICSGFPAHPFQFKFATAKCECKIPEHVEECNVAWEMKESAVMADSATYEGMKTC